MPHSMAKTSTNAGGVCKPATSYPHKSPSACGTSGKSIGHMDAMCMRPATATTGYLPATTYAKKGA